MDARKQIQNTEATTRAATAAESSSSEETCVVCFKDVEIYSIGECDHPVCYECSTRMRVLCQQNECPICRQILSKVIFTYDKLPYRELEAKNRSEYYSKKYKICFYTNEIQQAFFKLLDHPCPNCNTPPYRTFQALRNHVRKEHDLYFCDLCLDNLKIFTFERRCYTQAELGLHRTKGDVDNRSHRGHPLCEYCNKRYLDRDELFRHLRREHYFCHFCDADGCNEFYKDYDALAEHFRRDHYLCEEGKCATDQFVGAFRSEIDYKAHVANVHGKTLNKQQAKQTRTLQLEITLGPRGRSGQTEQGIANMRHREHHRNEAAHEEVEEPATPSTLQPNHRSINIDANNEHDFPSLAGVANGPNLSLARPPPQSLRNLMGAGGLARTRENFPALGGGSTAAASAVRPRGQQGPSMANAFKKPSPSNTGAIARKPTTSGNSNAASMVIQVSNRPTQNNNSKKGSASDFPALPTGKSKRQARLERLEEDLPPPNAHIPMENISAKHRLLVDEYVSVANPGNYQKMKFVEREEEQNERNSSAAGTVMQVSNRPTQNNNNKKGTASDFPALPTGKSKRQQDLPPPIAHKPMENISAKHRILAVQKDEEQKARASATSGNSSAPGMVIQVSNRPTQNNNNKKGSAPEFPALPMGKSKRQARMERLEEDLPPPNAHIPMENISAKHRLLVDEYVSVANPSNFQKMKLVQRNEEQNARKEAAERVAAPKLTSSTQFPSLGGSNNRGPPAGNIGTTWVKDSSEKRQRELENRQNKVAPPPELPNHNKAKGTTNNYEKKGKDKKGPAFESGSGAQTKVTTKSKEKNNNNEANLGTSTTLTNGNDASNPPIKVPPGFNNSVPPPGFQATNVTVNSVAKSPNNLTFTTSLGKSYSIVPSHAYTPPADATTRNQELVSHFKQALKTAEAVEEFRHISQKFREGVYKTPAYYEHCLEALGDRFDAVFPELLALLPDISQQQALYLVHTQRLNTLPPSERKTLPKLEVCSTCKQVLLIQDLAAHKESHELKANFPSLGSGGAGVKSATGSRK